MLILQCNTCRNTKAGIIRAKASIWFWHQEILMGIVGFSESEGCVWYPFPQCKVESDSFVFSGGVAVGVEGMDVRYDNIFGRGKA